MSRWWAIFWWAYLVWTVLSWTLSAEQVIVGLALSALTASVCARLGPAAGPWTLLRPRRIAALVRLAGIVVARVVVANARLSRRIWSPHIPLRSGMLIVPTGVSGDAALATVGVLTSVIVDSQLVDLDRDRRQLQYHAVWIDLAEARHNHDRINGPVERQLLRAGL
ncbi:Na+/H+ antiporter subunit E [Rugosimonospora acidiphila]|uniref:Na+/H+ antiporter subunit E n=1 Tax=Rugosimonospora acidiphila TaxID=556531 RepID=UPI0031E86492